MILYPNWSKKIAHLFTKSGVSVSPRKQVTYLSLSFGYSLTHIMPVCLTLGRACVSVLISLSLNLDPLSVVYLEFVRLDTSIGIRA